MTMTIRKTIQKKNDKKNQKRVKIKSKMPHANKKNTSEKSKFCSNIVFSLNFQISAIKFHAAKLLAFSLHFLFRRDQNHHYKLTKICEQIFKVASRWGFDREDGYLIYIVHSLDCVNYVINPHLLFWMV